MAKRKEYFVLMGLFLLVLGIRLYFALQTEQFSDSMSYFNLRQVESIRNTGLPIFEDSLSYSGRFYIFLPLMHYIIAFFSLVMPSWLAAKLVSSLAVSSLVIIVYLISKEITNKVEPSLAAASISGFLPILFYESVNTFTSLNLGLPLSFAALLLFIRAKPELKHILWFMAAMVLIVLADQSAMMVLVLGFFVYLMLSWLAKLKPGLMDRELIYTSTLLAMFFSLMAFKDVFLTYGPGIIRQNIPASLVSSYFQSFNIFEAIYLIGIIPFVFGIFVIYKHLLVGKNRGLYVVMSFALSVFGMIWLGLIQFSTGMIYFSVVLAILSGEAYRIFSEEISKTKFASRHNLFLLLFIGLIIASSVVPSISYSMQSISESPTKADIRAFEWMRNNTWTGTVVAASLESGHLITYFSNRKNIMDTNYLMQQDTEPRLRDLNSIYNSRFETEAIRQLNKYRSEYVIISSSERIAYENPLSYAEDSDCFKKVYDDEVIIYKCLCEIEESG